MSPLLTDLEVAAAVVSSAGLIWAGSAKLVHRAETAIALKDFHLTRVPSTKAAALASLFELAAGSGLAVAVLSGHVVTATSAAAVFLFAAFTFLVGRSLHRGELFSCMCFGSSTTQVSRLVLGRAAAFLAASVTSLAFSFSASASEVAFASRLSIACSIAAALGVVTLLSRLPVIVHRVDPFAALTDQLVVPTEGASGS